METTYAKKKKMKHNKKIGQKIDFGSDNLVICKEKNGIATLTLNRPKKFNSLSEEMITVIQKILEEIAKNKSIKIVIIQGAGKSFCAGHDLKEMIDTREENYYKSLFLKCSKMMMTINQIPQPVIAKVHGLAGLRVGFAISTPSIIKRLESYLTDSLNIIGLRAAIASYQDQRFQKHSIEMNNKAKSIVTDFLDSKGIQYLDSQTNFIFIKTGIEITELQPAMEKNGVLVGRPFPPFTTWCRLSLAKPEEMPRFNEVFEKVI